MDNIVSPPSSGGSDTVLRVVAISDWHHDLNLFPIPVCDVVCIAGDMVEGFTSFKLYTQWLDSLPATKVLLVPGNHDFSIRSMPYQSDKVHDLRVGPVKINNATFGGFWWSFCGDAPELERMWAFMTPYYDVAINKLEEIPPCDILISHSPPRGVLDLAGGSRHIGFPGLLEVALERGVSRIICGHVHECCGGTTLSVNGRQIMVYNVSRGIATLEI